MRLSPRLNRVVLALAMAALVLGASGCRMFGKKSELYTQSAESRPLEVPPDLNLPNTAGAMKLPPAAGQAAWVELAGAGDEVPLFGKTVTANERERAINEQIPQLIGMTLQNLAETSSFSPHQGPHCRWCSCKSACMILRVE